MNPVCAHSFLLSVHSNISVSDWVLLNLINLGPAWFSQVLWLIQSCLTSLRTGSCCALCIEMDSSRQRCDLKNPRKPNALPHQSSAAPQIPRIRVTHSSQLLCPSSLLPERWPDTSLRLALLSSLNERANHPGETRCKGTQLCQADPV